MQDRHRDRKRDHLRKRIKWRYIELVILVLIEINIALYSGFYLIANKNATLVYSAVVEAKKGNLKSNVHNVITYIDELRDELRHQGLPEEEIRLEIENKIRRKFYSEEFSDGSYMWINQILNYEGGDGYAIRLIHANLKGTEGQLLSTKTQDITGNYPYLEELKLINDYDGGFYEYYFQEIQSDNISEKITYAHLYEDYDWVICIGANIHSLSQYEKNAREAIQPFVTAVEIILSIVCAIITLLSAILFDFQHKKLLSNRNEELNNKLNIDGLTGANSRKYGETLLEDAFQSGRKDILIGFFDIDDFKKFNNEFGHEVGDKVLMETVKTVKHCIRTTDTIIRWGGDEFVLIIRGIESENVKVLAEKINRAVGGMTEKQIGNDAKVTISIGFTYFSDLDKNFAETVNRADETLYEVKAAQKNGWKLAER